MQECGNTLPSKVKFLGRHLMVKGRYVKLILSGKKTATIRLGIVKPKYREIIVHGGGKPVAKIEIVSVKHKKVKELTNEDAVKDGFRSKDELIKELEKVYDGITLDDWVTIIEFRVVQRLDNLPLQDPYMGLSPADIARLALRYLSNELGDDEKKVLLDLTRTESIRKTAYRIYGSIAKRYIVRRILKKVLNKLVDKNLLGRNNYKRPKE